MSHDDSERAAGMSSAEISGVDHQVPRREQNVSRVVQNARLCATCQQEERRQESEKKRDFSAAQNARNLEVGSQRKSKLELEPIPLHARVLLMMLSNSGAHTPAGFPVTDTKKSGKNMVGLGQIH